VRDCNAAALTVSAITFELTPLIDAPILLEPIPIPVARPLLLTVAAEVFDDDQAAELVMFCVLPSLKVPVAVNWSVVPFGMVD
jgi:hypothetical protein